MNQKLRDFLCSANAQCHDGIPERFFYTVWEMEDFELDRQQREAIKEKGRKLIRNVVNLDPLTLLKDLKLDGRRLI